MAALAASIMKGKSTGRDMVFELRETKKATALFEGWRETLIWSCLQGVMGKIYVDSLEEPISAMAVLGDWTAGRIYVKDDG